MCQYENWSFPGCSDHYERRVFGLLCISGVTIVNMELLHSGIYTLLCCLVDFVVKLAGVGTLNKGPGIQITK